MTLETTSIYSTHSPRIQGLAQSIQTKNLLSGVETAHDVQKVIEDNPHLAKLADRITDGNLNDAQSLARVVYQIIKNLPSKDGRIYAPDFG